MRRSTRAKKLIEEILPLTSYVQAQHGAALRIRIKWLGGNQSYDAHLTCSGSDVERGVVPKRQFLEVTTATHANEYLVREQLHKTGGAFAARSTHRNPKTRAIISEPSVYGHRELENELLTQISDVISKKVQKKYPRPTSLLVRCVVHDVILDDEWSYLVQELRNRGGLFPFREVLLFESISRRLSTIHRRQSSRRPTMQSSGRRGKRGSDAR